MSDSWPDIVHDLLRPEAYGLASGKVTLRTTHASWVFLTDARRLEAETPGGPRLSRFSRRRVPPSGLRGGGPAESTVGARCLSGGRARPPDRTRPYARRAMARSSTGWSTCGDCPTPRARPRFWNRAASTPGHSGRSPSASPTFCGRPDRPPTSARSPRSVGTLTRTSPKSPPSSEISSIRRPSTTSQAFQREELTRKATRFAERVAENRVREGHGDLRLEHVYLLPTKDGPSAARGHRLRRVRGALPLRRFGRRAGLSFDGARIGRPSRSGGGSHRPLCRGERRFWALRRPRFLSLLSGVGAGQGGGIRRGRSVDALGADAPRSGRRLAASSGSPARFRARRSTGRS